MIIYTKYSNDRRPELAIRTDITETDGKRAVLKIPATPRASQHIEKTARAGKALAKLFEGSPFRANRGVLKDGSLELEYLTGRTMEEVFDDLINDHEALKDALDSFLKKIETLADTSFEVTDGFKTVFGEADRGDGFDALKGLPAVSVSDIDMIPGNIIDGEHWDVIDYEWTFLFPLPVSFIIWRSLFYYIRTSGKRFWLEDEGLFEAFGIDAGLFALYEAMEAAFQAYVDGDRLPLRKLYGLISPGNIRIGSDLNLYTEKDQSFEVRVISDSGEKSLRSAPDGSFDGTFDAAGRPALELHLDIKPAVVHITSVEENGRPLERAVIKSDCLLTKDRDLISPDGGADVTLSGWGPDTKTVRVRFTTELLDPKMSGIWRRVGASLKEELSELATVKEERDAAYRRIDFDEAELARRTDIMLGLRDTKAMSLYRGLRKKRGQEDPFDRIRPEIPDDENKEIFSYLDSVSYHRRYMSLHGWVYDRLFRKEKFRLVNADGEPVKAGIARKVRRDVSVSLGLPETAMPGYEISILYENAKGFPWYLEIEDPRGFLKIPLEIDEDAVRRAAGGETSLYTPDNYDDTCRAVTLSEKELADQRARKFAYEPLISIVIPLYNTPLEYLKVMIDSVTGQTYGKWQLCLADGSPDDAVGAFIQKTYGSDGRIVYRRLEKNGGISENTNAAIAMAQGEYLMLADHDDIMDPAALYEIVSLLNECPEADVIYTDEDKVSEDGGIYFEPAIKPDFSWEALTDSNYICHIFCARRSLVDEAGYERSAFDGAQDYDFILRVCEKAGKICHIPKVLYHWRAHPASMAGNMASKTYAYERGRLALQGHFDRVGIAATAAPGDEPGHFKALYSN